MKQGKSQHGVRDESGATIIEFAVVAPVFFLLIFGIIEFGLVMFSSVAIESAVMFASRAASLGKSADPTGPCASSTDRVNYVECIVRDKTSNLINHSQVIITANPVAAGGVPATVSPDICLTNPPTVGGPCASGTPWQDVNGNGTYDAVVPPVTLGAAGDLVEVRVYYPWQVQIPFVSKYFGCHNSSPHPGCEEGIFMITSSTVIKNEPF